MDKSNQKAIEIFIADPNIRRRFEWLMKEISNVMHVPESIFFYKGKIPGMYTDAYRMFVKCLYRNAGLSTYRLETFLPKDHATIVYHMRRHDELMSIDKSYRLKYIRIEQRFIEIFSSYRELAEIQERIFYDEKYRTREEIGKMLIGH